MVKLGRSNKDHNIYVMVGTFALVFLTYLWVAPKLLKKPLGTPPRSGSNEESKQMARVQSGIPPQPVSMKGMDIGGF